MIHMGITEAKRRWSKILRLVAAGEKIIITRNGKAVGQLLPATSEESKKPVRPSELSSIEAS